MTTDTPRTDAFYPSDADFWEEEARRYCSNSQYWRERAEKAEAEVKDLKRELAVRYEELKEAREWLDERYKALSEADERAERAEADNVCLQELIQEFYEWSRRDFPTEQEVREIMNRYYDLLNK